MLNKRRQLAFQMLRFTPKDRTIKARLPEEYNKFSKELFERQPKPVHYIPEEGNWRRDPESNINIPIRTKFPPEMHNVLLGGEMVIHGFEKREYNKRRVPHFWVPELHKSVVYSEILNKHISAIVTQRLILQIHEYKGFDNYLLENAACDLRSNLALKIKKALLTALLEKRLPYDDKKNHELYEKYKKYIIPKEELEWYGLTLGEACKKQLSIEDQERRTVFPLKNKFRAQLLDDLQNRKPTELEESEKQDSWLSRMKKPFTRK